MGKWRIWQDEYWGDDWNDRVEISQPQGVELNDLEVARELLGYFSSEYRGKVEIDGDEDTVYATAYNEETQSYVGFHATRHVDSYIDELIIS